MSTSTPTEPRKAAPEQGKVLGVKVALPCLDPCPPPSLLHPDATSTRGRRLRTCPVCALRGSRCTVAKQNISTVPGCWFHARLQGRWFEARLPRLRLLYLGGGLLVHSVDRAGILTPRPVVGYMPGYRMGPRGHACPDCAFCVSDGGSRCTPLTEQNIDAPPGCCPSDTRSARSCVATK